MFCSPHLLSSQASISGNIKDIKSEQVSFANVLLLNAQDSSLIKGELSDEQGNFKLTVDPNLPVFISVSFLGYDEFSSSVITVNPDEKIVMVNVVVLPSASVSFRKLSAAS